jgi:predicted dehydrogenase
MASDAFTQLLEQFGRRIRLGLVGGGADSVIGGTHRVAFRTDGLYELVAGAMSIDPEIASTTARADLLADDRSYTDFRVMAERESSRTDGIDVVAIATPPPIHLDVAREFLRRGIDVICEKPMTATLEQARELDLEVGASGRLFMLTHCYSGYPMVRQARAMVSSGTIGKVTIADAELATGDPGVAREPPDPTGRHWNLRPETMGKGVILAEVGSHAHHLVRYVTGEDVSSVAAQLSTIAGRREVYDNAFLNISLEGGAVGRLWSSFVATGNEHGLAFRIFGTEGALRWRQEAPEVLWWQRHGASAVRLSRGLDELSPTSRAATRFRPGHPEGYALAFANLYRDFAHAFIARELGLDPAPFLDPVPGIEDGLATLALIEAAISSNEAGSQVVEVPFSREITSRSRRSARSM